MKDSEKLKLAIIAVLESQIDAERRFPILDYMFERYRSEVCMEAYHEKKNGKGE